MNPNDTVRVKLTLHGKRLIVAQTDALNDDLRRRAALVRRASPPWDKDDWLTGQFHVLMSDFGDCWFLGAELPFTELEKVP